MKVESTAAGPGIRPVKKPTTEPRAIGAADWRHSSRVGISSRSFTEMIFARCAPASAIRSTSATP